MLRIGITYYPGEAAHHGKNQTALALANVCSSLWAECHVVLVNPKEDGGSWWPSVERMAGVDDAAFSSLERGSLEYLIDVDGLISSDRRSNVAARSIVFLRTFLQFSEMDAAVYPEMNYVPRHIDGAYEVWCWDLLNPPETLDAVQVGFPCPLRRVPFVWTPPSVEAVETVEPEQKEPVGPWTVHVAETNTENTSSCVLPLVAIRELCQKQVLDATYQIHHTEHLKDNRFLQENVLNNIQATQFPIELTAFTGYDRWKEGKHVLFSHTRFQAIRLELLYVLWLGIPVVHNSPVLAELHPLLKGLSYTGNQIGGVCDAFRFLVERATEWGAAVEEIRAAILSRWGISVHQAAWEDIRAGLPIAPVTPAPVPIEYVKGPSDVLPSTIRIGFSDMWPGFNYDVNFFTDALRHFIGLRQDKTVVRGEEYSAEGEAPHLVIFGPYSTNWKQIPARIPKVFFSGENWGPLYDSSVRLYLTSSREEDASHVRIPTWMTFIDWFSGSSELPIGCEDNPIRLPLSLAMTPHPVGFTDRAEFCAFVVSNPICAMRNETYHVVNQYKTVNSGGHLYNNIGGPLELKYAGGGCGDISKHLFFAKHRFTISFENSQSPGYITEKVLHAKMAGCVPLYWGDAETDTDFVPGSIVNLSHVSDPEKVLAILQTLESREDVCARVASTPLLDAEKRDKALQTIQRMCDALLRIVVADGGVEADTGARDAEAVMPLAKIDKTYVVNLDRRVDRWNALLSAEPYWKELATRVSAVDGRSLRMSAFLYRLFEHNTFHWKKSIMGCSLSHISLWSKMVQESGDYFLVLEDDVRFQQGWRDEWAAYAKDIPEDADLLYLGGVLPPNKQALPRVLERVNAHWSRIGANTLFSHVPSPIFHFCTYSYIISKRGAAKLLAFFQQSEQKSFTSIDHILGHPMVGLVTYVATPLLASCFQDGDAVYMNSQFDNLLRHDQFDSDIWNNTECFSEEELAPFRHVSPSTQVVASEEKEMVVYYYSESQDKPYELYERTWLEDMFQRTIRVQPLANWTTLLPSNSWVLVQRPYSTLFDSYFRMLDAEGIPFKVLHLSDEFTSDCVDFYRLPQCKGVVRNYYRSDVEEFEKVVTIPLGYHYKALSEQAERPISERELVWSFYGTDWFGRGKMLAGLDDVTPHRCLLLPDWNHPSQLGEKEYLEMMANSRYVPILPGNHAETFRLYEALEAGAIPVWYSDTSFSMSTGFHVWMESQLGVRLFSPDMVHQHMLIQTEDELERKRAVLQHHWSAVKTKVRASLQRVLTL
jgi:GR25 family glycosyltransferase involved in LPS biosynthesis